MAPRRRFTAWGRGAVWSIAGWRLVARFENGKKKKSLLSGVLAASDFLGFYTEPKNPPLYRPRFHAVFDCRADHFRSSARRAKGCQGEAYVCSAGSRGCRCDCALEHRVYPVWRKVDEERRELARSHRHRVDDSRHEQTCSLRSTSGRDLL